jgi:hypothetical protein
MAGFSGWGVFFFVLITLLMLGSTVVDNLLMGAGAKQGGASWKTLGLALLGGVLGTLLMPPVGGIILAPLAVLLSEYVRLHDWQKAWSALRGLATGWGLSFVVRFLMGALMMGFWWLWVWVG